MDQAPDDQPIRGEVRLSAYRRVSHGLAVRRREGLTADAELRRDLAAYLLVLPRSAVFTHVTAAMLLGWRLPPLPEQVPVFVAVDERDPRPRRPGLICSRLRRERRPFADAPLPIDAPEEILLRAAREFGVLDLVVMIDSALEKGHLNPDRMEQLLASRRPGVAVLRRAWELASRRRESAGESVLGVYLAAMDIDAEPQVELHGPDGRPLGRADFLVRAVLAVEYDGQHHRHQQQQRVDLRRERAWIGTAYERLGVTLDDLLNHPAVLMHELDRFLGRPHRPQRLARWRRAVDNSLYSERGRTRLMNRWRRHTGLNDWSRAA
jgi:hypothetical protein